MLKNLKIRPVYKLTALILVLVAVLALVSGCTATRGAVARGWAGGVILDNVLYMGSMEGHLVMVDLTDMTVSEPVLLEEVPESSGGFLSCGTQASAGVVMYGSPTVDGDYIYVSGYNTGELYAVNTVDLFAKSKALKKDDDSNSELIVGGPVVYKDNVYIGSSDGYVYSLSTVNLRSSWREPFETGDKIWSTPAVANDTVYIGSFDKKMYALDAADGSLKWDPFETEGAIVTTPLVDGNALYFGSFDRNIYAVNADNGQLIWKYKADRWFWAKPVVYNDTLYAPCLDGKVYALDKATGDEIEVYDLENPISSSPVIVDDILLVATQKDKKGDVQDSKLHAIDLKSGTLDVLTTFDDNEDVYANLIAGDGKVFVHTTLNRLYQIDVETGAQREIVISTETEEEKDEE